MFLELYGFQGAIPLNSKEGEGGLSRATTLMKTLLPAGNSDKCQGLEKLTQAASLIHD
jgi:hypothetical protein